MQESIFNALPVVNNRGQALALTIGDFFLFTEDAWQQNNPSINRITYWQRIAQDRTGGPFPLSSNFIENSTQEAQPVSAGGPFPPNCPGYTEIFYPAQGVLKGQGSVGYIKINDFFETEPSSISSSSFSSSSSSSESSSSSSSSSSESSSSSSESSSSSSSSSSESSSSSSLSSSSSSSSSSLSSSSSSSSLSSSSSSSSSSVSSSSSSSSVSSSSSLSSSSSSSSLSSSSSSSSLSSSSRSSSSESLSSSSQSSSSFSETPLDARLVGFPLPPDYIEVTIGDAWDVSLPFSEDDVLTLSRVPGTEKWSEDGSLTANATTNRLMIYWELPHPSYSLNVRINCVNTAGTAFAQAAIQTNFTVVTYTFKDWWSVNPAFQQSPAYIPYPPSPQYQDMFKTFNFITP